MKKQKIIVTSILLVLSFIFMPISSVFAAPNPSTPADIVYTAVNHKELKTFVSALQAAGLEINMIKDVTPIPHNGCRPPKRRRV